jgi:hypothetical protein
MSVERMALADGVELIVGARRPRASAWWRWSGWAALRRDVPRRRRRRAAGRRPGGELIRSPAARRSWPAPAAGRRSTWPRRHGRRRPLQGGGGAPDIAEIEVNPLLVTVSGAAGLDARIIPGEEVSDVD